MMLHLAYTIIPDVFISFHSMFLSFIMKTIFIFFLEQSLSFLGEAISQS